MILLTYLVFGLLLGAVRELQAEVIFQEPFEESGSFGQFTVVDVTNPEGGWTQLLWDFGTTGAAQGNGFGAGDGPTEDWLITTNPLNLDYVSGPITLNYDAQISFDGPPLEVLFSSDYDPATMTDPNDATWMTINSDESRFDELTEVGPFDITDVTNNSRGYLAYKYTSIGPNGGQSVRATIDDVTIDATLGFPIEGESGTSIEDNPGKLQVFNLGSAFGWQYSDIGGLAGAYNSNFGSAEGGSQNTVAANDWLVFPAFSVTNPATFISFMYYERFGDTIDAPLKVFVTDSYTGDATTTTWADITPDGLNGSTDNMYVSVDSKIIPFTGSDIVLAFQYEASGSGGGQTKNIGISMPYIAEVSGPLEASFAFTQLGTSVSFRTTVSGGIPPYSYSWDFGDFGTSLDSAPSKTYAASVASYTVALTVSDSASGSVMLTDTIDITMIDDVPSKDGTVRVATFNTAFSDAVNRVEFAQRDELAGENFERAKVAAEIIQRTKPDIVFLNEFDHVWTDNDTWDGETTKQMLENFKTTYLEVSQADGLEPIVYPFIFVAPCNTGVQSGFDLSKNGEVGDGGDAYGFGDFPGAFSMAFLSKYPILEEDVRTFQYFLWKDMPDALLPPDPNDVDGDGNTASYYTEEELEVFRLSSKSHWDIPVNVDGETVHILGSHPTPPVFDDGTASGEYPSTEVADWNGLRNHDEIRFWADYIDPSKGSYIYDDEEWLTAGSVTPASPSGGLAANERFVIVGDQNADPIDGDSTYNPILLLLDNPLVDTSSVPESQGAAEQVADGQVNPEQKTSTFNLRVDYALPSSSGLELNQAFMFWPELTDIEAYLIASDHFLVGVDIDIVPTGSESTQPPVSAPDYPPPFPVCELPCDVVVPDGVFLGKTCGDIELDSSMGILLPAFCTGISTLESSFRGICCSENTEEEPTAAPNTSMPSAVAPTTPSPPSGEPGNDSINILLTGDVSLTTCIGGVGSTCQLMINGVDLDGSDVIIIL